jgi:hypothetical protein
VSNAEESVTVISVPEGPSLIARGVSLWYSEYEFDEPRRGERELSSVVQINDRSLTNEIASTIDSQRLCSVFSFIILAVRAASLSRASTANARYSHK